MKCPKCGYNSFEFLDNCKKCNADLRSLKQTLGIRAFAAQRPPQAQKPADEPAAPPPTPEAAPSAPEPPVEPAPTTAPDLDFRFEEQQAAGQATETFSFDELLTSEELPPAREETLQKTEEFSFEDFGLPKAGEEPAPVVTAPATQENKDILEGFEWEGTAIQEKAPGPAADQDARSFATSGPSGEFDLSAFSFEEPEPPKEPKKKVAPEKSTIFSDFEAEEFKSLFDEGEEK